MRRGPRLRARRAVGGRSSGQVRTGCPWSAPEARGSGEVTVPGPNQHVAMAGEVANHDRATPHDRERAVAGVLRQPLGAAHGGLAVAAVGAEAPAPVAAPEAAHGIAADVGGVGADAGTACASRRAGAAGEVAAAEVEVHAAAGAAGLADLHHAAAEGPRLLLAVE